MASIDMDTTTIDMMPPEIRGLFYSALEHVQSGEQSMQYAWDELRSVAQSTLTAGEHALASAHDELIGQCEACFSKSEAAAGKAWKELYKKADNHLLEGSGSLMDAGWKYPYTIDEMRAELDSGIGNHVIARVPELAAAYEAVVGYAPELTPPMLGTLTPPLPLASNPTNGDTTSPPTMPPVPTILPVPPLVPPVLPQPVLQIPPPPPPPLTDCDAPRIVTTSSTLVPGTQTGYLWCDQVAGVPSQRCPPQQTGESGRISVSAWHSDGTRWCLVEVTNGYQQYVQSPPYNPVQWVNATQLAIWISGVSPPPPPPPVVCGEPTPDSPLIEIACPNGFDPLPGAWIAWQWKDDVTPPYWIQVDDSGDIMPGYDWIASPPPHNPGEPTCVYTTVCRPRPTHLPPPPPPPPPPTECKVTLPPPICCPTPSGVTIGDVDETAVDVIHGPSQQTDFCDYMDQLVDGINNAKGNGIPGDWPPALLATWGPINKVLINTYEGRAFTVDANANTLGPLLAEAVSLSTNNRLAHGIIQALSGGVLDDAKTAASAGAMLAAGKLVESKIGFPMTYLMKPIQYALQFSNPNTLPSQADANLMYIMGGIGDDDWQCLTETLGNIAPLARQARDLAIGHLDVRDVITLRKRGITQSDTEMYQQATRAGWRDTRQVDMLWDAMKAYPQVADIIRFMVRDVFDPAVVAQYQYDKDFEQKIAGRAREFADALGLDQDMLKYWWRAHWNIPSDTQLFTMVHRLRPDRPDVRDWDERAKDTPPDVLLKLFGPRPPVVTVDDVKRAVEVNDLAPTWVDPLIATSYNPITRTDAVRAYEIGSYTEDQLLSAFQDNGYNERDARLLVKFHREAKARTLANATGVLTIRKVIAYYRDSVITRDDADRMLTPLVINDTDRLSLLDRTDMEMQATYRKVRIQGVRRSYVFGEIDVLTVQNQLADIGVPPSQQALLVGRWQADMANRLREPTVRQLCTWYNHRIITSEQYYTRLRRLGWDIDDANRILATCDQDWKEKLRKAEAALQKEVNARTEKELKSLYQIEHASDAQLAASIKREQDRLARLEAEQRKRQASSPPPPPPPPK